MASLFSGCGVLDYGLTQAGHEIILQTESEDSAREVLAARFQGICQPRDAGMVETLPADTDVLAASVVSAELEGSWRESWSKDSVASKLKQVLRLMKSSPRTPWVLIEASTALLENPDGDGVPMTLCGGGHSELCVRHGAVLIHFVRMNSTRCDPATASVTIGPGALLGQVNECAQTHGLAVPTGVFAGVGVGSILAGGIGRLAR